MELLNENPRNLKTKLVEVAVSELAKPRALKLPTMRQLAEAAGVAPGAAYRHFASQDELFLAVIRHLFTALENELQLAMSKSNSTAEKVAAMAHTYVLWGTNNSGAYQLILETTDTESVLESGERAGLHLLDHLAALLSSSGHPTADSTNQATQLWTSLHGIVSLRNHKIGMPWLNTIEQQVNDLLKSFI